MPLRRKPRRRLITVSRAWWWGLVLSPGLTFVAGFMFGATLYAVPSPSSPAPKPKPMIAVPPVEISRAPLDARVDPTAEPEAAEPLEVEPEEVEPEEVEPEEVEPEEVEGLEPALRPAVPDYATRGPSRGFGVQVAAHNSLEEAEGFLRDHGAELETLGAFFVLRRRVSGVDWYRVRVGTFPTSAAATAAAKTLPETLGGAMVVRYR